MTRFALSPDIDVERAAMRLDRTTRVHIPSVLEDDTAAAIDHALRTERAWTRAVMVEGGSFYAPLVDDQPQEAHLHTWLAEARINGAHGGMQYIQDTRRLSQERSMGLDRGDLLNDVEAWLNGPEMIGLVREISGEDKACRCDVQASRFLPGHALTAHSDWDGIGERLVAFVLNFSRPWRADWGGLLAFYGQDGHVSEAFVPTYNSLNLFTTPQSHAVTQVASFAEGPRLAISGWFTT